MDHQAETGEPIGEGSQNHQLDVFPVELLQHVADDIEFADTINPNAWSLGLAQGGWLVFFVEQYSILMFDKSGNGAQLLLGNPEHPRFASLDKSHAQVGFKNLEAFRYLSGSLDETDSLLKEFASERRELISKVAPDVKKRTQRARDHRPALVGELSQLFHRALPQPAYLNDVLAERASRQATSSTTSSSQEQVPDKRYWKISPGSNAMFWDEFKKLSVIAVHWVDDLADLRDLPDDRENFLRAVAAYPDGTAHAARALWSFREDMGIGDFVLAYGNRAVLGFGAITGDYQAVQDEFSYNHRRPVAWQSLDPLSVDSFPETLRRKLSRNTTLIELTQHEFEEATGQASVAALDPLPTIRDQFAANGLHYTDAQIATFYTSLQTKGFVVLSGISGTGKSKIATGFVEMLPGPASEASLPLDTTGLIPITVKPYMRSYKRVVLPTRYVDLLPPLDIGRQVEIDIVLDGVKGNGRIEHLAHASGSSITVLYFRGEIGNAVSELEVNTRLYLRPALGEDGDSIQQVELLRSENLPSLAPVDEGESKPTNHLFLAVRPDWRDSTSLLGYYNPLAQTYEWTEFLHFIIQARDNFRSNNPIAWFVILDEMNLAHVEYYFADLLSVLESGRDKAGLTKEALRMTYPDILDDDVPPRELHLPPNLYIIGTVNMDETTHAFSPKVLDRAFTIELADVSFDNYPITTAGSEAAQLSDSQKTSLLAAFTRDGKFARIDKDEHAEIVASHPRIRHDLAALNALLQPHRMHFGYRVFDEICQYLYNNDLNKMMTFEQAFDQAVFMKVLPKFSGSRARLQSPLHGVLTWAVDPHHTTREDVAAAVALFNAYSRGEAAGTEAWMAEPVFPAVAARVRDMLVALERDGFVSFG